MNTTRRDESKKKFYAEVKDILEKKHRESSWYMMELMGVEGKEEADRKKAFRIMMNKLTEPYPASRPQCAGGLESMVWLRQIELRHT